MVYLPMGHAPDTSVEYSLHLLRWNSMKATILDRLSRSCFRALLVFLVWTCVGHDRVFAGCRSQDLPMIPLADRSLDRVVEPVLADLIEIPAPQKPCTGPMCSGRPSIPLEPATPDVQRIASWAILTVTTPFLLPVAFEGRPSAQGVRPTHSPASIFHPPRFAPAWINS
jgi:hypothetical protein